VTSFYVQQGEAGRTSAIDHASRILVLEPWREEAHRQLMLLYAQSGHEEAALSQFQTCERILAEELGISPSAETTALFGRILAGRDQSVAVDGPSPVLTPMDSQLQRLPSFLGEENVPAERTVFVARERELAFLRRHLEAALADAGRVSLVVGEMGSGKTALIRAFAREAQETSSELVAAIVSCSAHTGPGDPYGPFRELLALLTGDVEAARRRGTITRENARRLRHLLPLTLAALVDLGPDLIDTLVPREALSSRAAALIPQQVGWLNRLAAAGERRKRRNAVSGVTQRELVAQVTNVLDAVARERPLLLVIDDAQWADAASINLLFHLARRLVGSRILFVIAYRPHDVAVGRPAPLSLGHPEPGRGQQDSAAAREPARHPLEAVTNELKRTFGDIEVDLDEAIERSFVDAYLDAHPNRLGPGFREALVRQTLGHPLFTVELLRHLEERGHIKLDGAGRLVAGSDVDWDTLPARVVAVIEERVGRLNRELREVLTVASVEGERFTAQVIAQVQGVSERQMLAMLSQELAGRHRLVREAGEVRVAGGGRHLSHYQFAHTLIQGYLYHSLSAGERRLLHGEIGQRLEGLYGENSTQIAVKLAHHYTKAGLGEKVIEYALHVGV
jgi:predicted ATPase